MMTIYDEIFLYVMVLYDNIRNNDGCPVELPLNASYRELALTAREVMEEHQSLSILQVMLAFSVARMLRDIPSNREEEQRLIIAAYLIYTAYACDMEPVYNLIRLLAPDIRDSAIYKKVDRLDFNPAGYIGRLWIGHGFEPAP